LEVNGKMQVYNNHFKKEKIIWQMNLEVILASQMMTLSGAPIV
jgi:hypothetical protein